MTHENIISTFDSWAQDGRAEGMEEGHGDVVRQVISQLGIRPGMQSLDLGCGSGWATRLLASSAPGAGAVGVDASPEISAVGAVFVRPLEDELIRKNEARIVEPRLVLVLRIS